MLKSAVLTIMLYLGFIIVWSLSIVVQYVKQNRMFQKLYVLQSR
jgi:hypothetical protein